MISSAPRLARASFCPFLSLAVLLTLGSCSTNDEVAAPDDADGFFDVYQDVDVDGDGLQHHIDDCEGCHDVFGESLNLRFIPDTLSTPSSGDRTVVFRSRTGANSFADGDGVYDGVCEVCHTTTDHHRNNASGDHEHYAGSDCVLCHLHSTEFLPMGASGPAHSTHIGGGRGVSLGCTYCHEDGAALFQDGETFATTHVCDECHSPGGVVDGVDDPIVGARTNWPDGVYSGDALMPGREAWCGGCHDLGTSTVDGVSAPPVSGDGTWGYDVTGHGRSGAVSCTDCHDPTAPHFDGVAHSYAVPADNYQEAFRLADQDGSPPLTVPRTGFAWDDPYTDPPYYDLCFSCHDKHALLGSPTAPAGSYRIPQMMTNFRSDSVLVIPDGLGTNIAVYSVSGAALKNSHYTHLVGPPHIYDSDRDGAVDSYGTCVACHNVHGSSSPAMIRDGKLIGHEPGLNYGRVKYDRHGPFMGGCADPIIMTSTGVTGPDSQGGVMRANSGPAANGVCNFCHCGGSTTGDPEYEINCYGPDCVDYYRTYVTPPDPLTP